MLLNQPLQTQPTTGNPPTRAIFLDIDGVLHPTTAIEHFNPLMPLAESMARHQLMRWCDDLADLMDGHDDVLLFVHSSWRFQFENADLRMALGRLGHLYEGITDQEERNRFPSITQMAARAGLDDYLILDDARDAFPADCAQLVLCNPLLGITEDRVKTAVRTWLQASAAPRMA